MDVLSKLVGVQDGKSIRLEFIRKLVQEFAKSRSENGTCADCLMSCIDCVEKYQRESSEDSPE